MHSQFSAWNLARNDILIRLLKYRGWWRTFGLTGADVYKIRICGTILHRFRTYRTVLGKSHAQNPLSVKSTWKTPRFWNFVDFPQFIGIVYWELGFEPYCQALTSTTDQTDRREDTNLNGISRARNDYDHREHFLFRPSLWRLDGLQIHFYSFQSLQHAQTGSEIYTNAIL